MTLGLMLDEQISDYKKYLEGFDWEVKTVEDIGKKARQILN